MPEQLPIPLDLPEMPPKGSSSAPVERAARSWEPWSAEEDQRLMRLFHSGQTTAEMAEDLERPSRGIAARLVRLQLIDSRKHAP